MALLELLQELLALTLGVLQDDLPEVGVLQPQSLVSLVRHEGLLGDGVAAVDEGVLGHA